MSPRPRPVSFGGALPARPAAAPVPPGSPEPDAAAVPHAGRDVHAVALDLARAAAPLAGRAGVLDLGPRAPALAAGLGDREQPLRLRLEAAALAARADGRRGARLRARPVTGGAGRRQRHRDRHLGTLHRLVERHVHLGLEVPAALGARGARAAAGTAAHSAEQVREDVAHAAEAAAERAGVEAAARAAEDPAARVVRLALVRVGQDRVRLLHLLEALLGGLVAGVAVRVVLAGELAVGLLYLLVGGLAVDAQRPVL